jgi:uncharacterized membrane protein YtjA (UPF0391 family)
LGHGAVTGAMKGAIMSTHAVIIVLALALLLSGVAEQADNDLNEALGIKHTPLLQLIVGIGTGLLIWKSFWSCTSLETLLMPKRWSIQGLTYKEIAMLGWALTFLVIALIAAALGFGGIAGAAAGIAKIIFYIFLVLLLVSLIMHFVRGTAP